MPKSARHLTACAMGPLRLPIVVALLALPGTVLGHGTANPGTADAARQITFPDTAEHRTLVVDLHTHTVFSDGHVWPKIRVEEAMKDGLDALAVTEHLEWQPHRFDIPHPDRNRAFEDTLESLAGQDLLVIPGSEITREAPAGHMNAVFVKDANALLNVADPPADAKDTRAYYNAAAEWPAQAAVDAANEQGAFVFWNHPYWTRQAPDGIARMNDFHAANARAGKLHGIEVANGATYSAEAHALALEYDLALIGVSDVHDLIDWDYDVAGGGHRPVTLVLATERSLTAIREALFARRTVIWFKNLLIGREADVDALLSASLATSNAHYVDETSVLELTITNVSDAEVELSNLSDYTFVNDGPRVSVPAQGSTTLRVKTGNKLAAVKLAFRVDNALIAPDASAHIELVARVNVE